MEHGTEFILVGAFVMMLSMLMGQLSSRLGAPVLLTVLAVGIFFGENGPGGIVFNDHHTAFLICSVALAMILFDGGLRTPVKDFKVAVKPAFVLSTLGVLVTAAITGGFAIWLMGLSTLHGLLLGSIVASTDAAAVFLLLHQRGVHLRERVSATLEVESGINDPMAVFLTFTFVTLLTGSQEQTLGTLIGMFIKQMGLGLLLGYAGGKALAALLRSVRFPPGLYPVVVMVGGLLVFSGTNVVEGSGFLAVYLAGVTFASCGYQKLSLIKQFNDGMAWVAQLIMLLTLGLLATPVQLLQYAIPSVMIAVVLTLVARPTAVWLSLIGSGFGKREKTFISWVGLRGAIPIYLALIPALAGVENGQFYFNCAFTIVCASLLIQGWTINPLARILKITQPSPAAAKDH